MSDNHNLPQIPRKNLTESTLERFKIITDVAQGVPIPGNVIPSIVIGRILDSFREKRVEKGFEDIIKYMYENQDKEFKRLNLNFKRIGNRELQLIDCQNIFCELDKYCRQALPELKSNRKKIKKKYIPKTSKIEYMYPPKWKVELY